MSIDWREALDAAIAARFEQMVELRRHLHAHPEASGQERETSLHLYQLLGEEGFPGADGAGRGGVSWLTICRSLLLLESSHCGPI